MFGDIALDMLKMMGHSGTVPGSISAQDVPDALSRLTSALSAKNAAEENLHTDVDEEEEQAEPAVSLGRRAFPLIELLKSAIKEECEVMWDNQ
jgi:Flp pilus assembly CpaF family ATPase